MKKFNILIFYLTILALFSCSENVDSEPDSRAIPNEKLREVLPKTMFGLTVENEAFRLHSNRGYLYSIALVEYSGNKGETAIASVADYIDSPKLYKSLTTWNQTFYFENDESRHFTFNSGLEKVSSYCELYKKNNTINEVFAFDDRFIVRVFRNDSSYFEPLREVAANIIRKTRELNSTR